MGELIAEAPPYTYATEKNIYLGNMLVEDQVCRGYYNSTAQLDCIFVTLICIVDF